MRNTLFIVNPVAGAGRAEVRWKEFRSLAGAAGIHGERVLVRRSGEAPRLAAAAAHTHKRIVAAGGDGTVQEVASGILRAGNPNALLGIVPLGTGNDVARALGILSPTDAVNALRGSRTRTTDTIQVDCVADGERRTLHALSLASVGIAGEVLKRTTPAIKRVCGPRLAYYIGLFRALWHYHASMLDVAWDGQAARGRFLFVGASNTEYAGGGMRLAPGALMDDGLLAVNLIDEVGRWETCRQLGRLAQGRHTEHPRVRYFSTASLSIGASPSTTVEADGELAGFTPARFQVRPKALRIFVP